MKINYEKLKDAYDIAAVSYYENKYVVGGWGTNRESTATTMIARTKYILLIFILQCNYKGLFFLTLFLHLH